MENKFNDKIPARLVQLVIRWKEQSNLVQQDLEDYTEGYFIKKSKISKDVSNMKATFKQIETILKEL